MGRPEGEEAAAVLLTETVVTVVMGAVLVKHDLFPLKSPRASLGGSVF